MAAMRKCVIRIQKQAPKVAERYREQLRERIRQAGLGLLDFNDERLIKEVVFFADRSDISEELTRVQSHFQQFDDCLESAEPVGRTTVTSAFVCGYSRASCAAMTRSSAVARDAVIPGANRPITW